jgi:hypothetical protein
LSGLSAEAIGQVLGFLGILLALGFVGWILLRLGRALMALGSERTRRKELEAREKRRQERLEALSDPLERGDALRSGWDELQDPGDDSGS